MIRQDDDLDEILDESFRACRENMMIGWGGEKQDPILQVQTVEREPIDDPEKAYADSLISDMQDKLEVLRESVLNFDTASDTSSMLQSVITQLLEASGTLDSATSSLSFMKDLQNNLAREEGYNDFT